MAEADTANITKATSEERIVEAGEKESAEKSETKSAEGTSEATGKANESGIRRRIKLNIPGIISTDKSSKKPPSYGWAQQRLPACRPVYTGYQVFFVFLLFGIILVVVGAVLLAYNLRLHEYGVSYTNCNSSFAVTPSCSLPEGETNETITVSFPTCADYVANISDYDRGTKRGLCPCYCQVSLNVEENMTLPIYVFYKLTNYYQNHRRYISSWSPRSLRADDIIETQSACDPLSSIRPNVPYFPCGLVANSFFNDTLSLEGVTINSTDIAWETDRNTRFLNPPEINVNGTTEFNRTGTVLPPNWLDYIDNGQRNESYMVWLRVSAFPVFRKFLGRINLPEGVNVLPAGNYTLNIVYNYPVTIFNGGKEFIIAEANPYLGTRNLFLGISYLVTGGLCIAAGVLMLIVRLTCSKWKVSDKSFLKREY